MSKFSLPTLYKKNSNGSFQQWTISVVHGESDEGPVAIYKEYGQVGGKLQTSDPDWIVGKNIGKANETTPYEQACLEAESQWKKKKTGGKGYVESMDDAAEGKKDVLVTGGADPMLAHKYGIVIDDQFVDEQSKKIAFPAFVQPKLDGSRCLAVIENGKVTLWTRTRKPIVSMPHVIEQLEKLIDGTGITEGIVDGELYNHDYHDNFEDLMSLIKPEYVKDGHKVVEYHIYDVVSPDNFSKRLDVLNNMGQRIQDSSLFNLKIVPTTLINSHEDAMEKLEHWMSQGYEGIMIRNMVGGYEGKRSYNLLKLKKFYDAEFEIVDVVEGRGKMAGKAVFVCTVAGHKSHQKMDKGYTFQVKMDGNLDRLAEIWENRDEYVGKDLTVRYQGMTAYGIPRFPVGKAIRDYE